jgi:predicted ATPase/class 3 adenylate cyclase
MQRDLPTGVVTLLFTDVEGSTKLLHELGDGYADALHEHRRLLRAAFAAHGGVEVDTQGDAFLVAFAQVSEAVAAAKDAQRALADGPIRVRMGLHTGEPRVTDEGYVGLDVHKGARIAAVGHGGQVLLSHSTRALVEDEVRDLGPHRLKDLTLPERIYQLKVEGLRSDFPLLQTLDAGSTNLPSPGTSFVGRAEELDAIDGLLEDPDCRLLTLVGPGGVGKTRLAVEVAARRVDRHAHGVHFVPLTSVPTTDLIAPALAEALQFAVDGAHSAFSAQDQLLDYLSERSTLLVLDNFEHLVDGSGLLALILERAPRVELLTTSRERLRLQGEWLFEVEGLGEVTSAGPNGETQAIRLFAERARQSDPRFTLGAEDRPHAARICRLVEGMPLGIELAAGWASMLDLAELADEIERSLDFLASSKHDVPARHRSLRAVFDQSWGRLDDEQRHVLERLAVFRGSFTRSAAAAVTGAGLPVLFELVGRSLVRRTELGRFELHELVRQYAAERLARARAELESACELHCRFYVGLLAERRDALLGGATVDARDEIRAELGNLRVAAEWAVTHWSEHEAREVLSLLLAFYDPHSWYEGGEAFAQLAEERRVRKGSDATDREGSIAASARAYQTLFKSLLGYDELSEEVGRACLPRLRELGLLREAGLCLNGLGMNAVHRDEYAEAAHYLEEAVDMARAVGEAWDLWAALLNLGWTRLLQGDLEAARAAFEEGHETASELGNPRLLAFALSKLGLLADAEGDYAEALRQHMKAEEAFERVGDRGGQGYALSRASMSAYALGDHAGAMRFARAGYEAFSEVNHRWGVMSALCRMGFAALGLGELEQAREDFCRVLQLAHESQATSLVLHALSGMGALLARDGEERRAVELLSFALGHPALPDAYRAVVQPELDRLEADQQADELAAARQAAAAADIEELVADALQTHAVE